jgi:hypothetical protein
MGRTDAKLPTVASITRPTWYASASSRVLGSDGQATCNGAPDHLLSATQCETTLWGCLCLQTLWPGHRPGDRHTYDDLALFIHNFQRGTRYLKLNPYALIKHGTLEFRQPRSSTCIDEVCCSVHSRYPHLHICPCHVQAYHAVFPKSCLIAYYASYAHVTDTAGDSMTSQTSTMGMSSRHVHMCLLRYLASLSCTSTWLRSAVRPAWHSPDPRWLPSSICRGST